MKTLILTTRKTIYACGRRLFEKPSNSVFLQSRTYMPGIKIVTFLFGLFLSGSSFSQSKDSSLVVFGDGFSFSITEPGGWKGDIEHAKKYEG